MKRMLAIMLAVVMALGLTGCSSDLGGRIAEKILIGALEGALNAPANAADTHDGEMVTAVLAAIGPDTIERAKAADISLDFSFSAFSDGTISVSVEIRSGISSTWPENTVDWEVMRDIQYAVLDTLPLGLSDAELAMFKDNYYTPSGGYCDIDTDSHVNLHINETPSYEAIVCIRPSYDAPKSGERVWFSMWDWDECCYDSRSN